MVEIEDVLVWEVPQQAGGGSGCVFVVDLELVRALEKFMPSHIDLDEWVSERKIFKVEERYVLTKESYDDILATARKSRPDLAATLEQKKSQYYLRSAQEAETEE
jgi:hypothetical protein